MNYFIKYSKGSNLFYLPFVAYQLEVIFHLGWRNFILRYKGSALGLLWSLVPPLSQLFVFSFVFGRVIRFGIEAYPLFLFVGILPWNWFVSCLSSAGTLFTVNRDLIRKPNFIPVNLVIADTVTNLVPFLILLPILCLLMMIFGRGVPAFIPFVILIIVIQAILIIGIVMFISIANVIFQDIQHIVNILLMFLLFMSPIFYSTDGVDTKYKFIFKYNPIAVLIDSYRAIFYYNKVFDINALVYVAVVSIIIFMFGVYFYKRTFYKIYDYL